ncbi:hypothetical protein F5X68DRAFT_226547 [Plectosphaerella plurivora]|uniref:NmrA-like domain-containing protein n=1 Tax=Plectosphaerella plurivora TaxID=936078 RepID=A0A9P8VP49_9PEZI|nr:hypothetical protein F5X68DRAFT_226547 [Plectosphaerella plurivora]
MSSSPPTVFVVTATGAQGSAVCRQLRHLGWSVRATVRSPDSRPARALTDLGVTITPGSYDDEAAFTTAFAGCSILFLALVPDYRNMDNERIWATRILRIARAAGVTQVIYSSSISADAPESRGLTLPPDHLFFKMLFSKNAIEGIVRRAGFPTWTILRPGFFMTNLLDPKVRMYPELFERNTWLTGMTPETKIGFIDPEDIAAFAVAAMQDPERFGGQEINLVGERLTPGQAMEALSGVIGRTLEAKFHTEEEIATMMATNPLVGAQVALRGGEEFADVAEAKSWGVPMGTFQNFLARENAAVQETYN